ncbi:hypothetical protein TMatcc_005693 [Talaromyces marneffei ATCC 18224]
MSRFRDIRLSISKSKSSAQSTRVPAVHHEEWSPIANSRESLQRALEDMYWEGVRDELENIIRPLAIWQQPEFADVLVPDENDDFIHGFDTFVDQVSQHAREHAIRYNKKRIENMDLSRKLIDAPPPSYMKSLNDAATDRRAESISSKIKSAVRQTMEDMPSFTGIEKRAWVLLQAAGFLDIEKLIEDRPATKKQKRPVVPQLDFSKGRPLDFYPMHCANAHCNAIITGSMFKSDDPKEPRVVCEDCYFRFFYGKDSYVKQYKHSILPEAITPEESRRMCPCYSVPHFNGDKPLALFPVPWDARHQKYTTSSKKCELDALDDLVAISKYKALRKAAGIKETKRERNPNSVVDATMKLQHRQPQAEKSSSNQNLHSLAILDKIVTDPQEDPDVPAFFKAHVDKDPFANVHVRLRVGPLIIRNDISLTEDGALITLRETPVFHQRLGISGNEKRCLLVTGSEDQNVWQFVQPARHLTNYKAVMKQVVGAPFSGLLPQDPERALVCDILDASQSLSSTGADLGQSFDKLLGSLRNIMGSRVQIYIDSIAERLLNPATRLARNATQNNYQHFCNSLIDHDIFGPLTSGLAYPLYLMSFVCPDEGYMRPPVLSKFSVPTGLTQDYISQFYFGHSTVKDSDIIDTYQEYWYDWGAFGGPIYKYQNIFPWDCTEAYGRYPTCCGDCNLSKHVRAFPFDSWSIVSHHLTRDQHMYAPSSLSEPMDTTKPTSQAWMRNRLNVLSASAILCRAAAAMAKTEIFRSATAWLSPSSNPGSELRSLDPSLARVKLGGIHRAQPFSHLLFDDKIYYSSFFMAHWGIRPLPQQIEAYEIARRKRINRADIELPLLAEDAVGYTTRYRRDSKDTSNDAAEKFEIDMDAALTLLDTVYRHAAGCAVACGATCASGCGNSSCGGVVSATSYPSTEEEEEEEGKAAVGEAVEGVVVVAAVVDQGAVVVVANFYTVAES